MADVTQPGALKAWVSPHGAIVENVQCIISQKGRGCGPAFLRSQVHDKSRSPPTGHKSFRELPRFIGQHVDAQCNLQTNSPALGTVIKVNIAALARLAERLVGLRCLNTHFINAGDDLASRWLLHQQLQLHNMSGPIVCDGNTRD